VLEVTPIKQNCMHKEIKSRINSWNSATIWFRMFRLPIYYLTTHRINNTKVKFSLFFNLVSHIKGRTLAKRNRGLGVEGDIWIKDGGSNRRQEKKKHEELQDLYSLTNITGVIKSRQMRKLVGHVREENCIKSVGG
jgi:hypothetical protein